jgi:ABC-2 type transport system ATP-binding protein
MLRVEDLVKRFNGRPVVDGVSFRIHAGEIFGLLGPNGAGKTTTLRILLGIFQPDAGAIHFELSRSEPYRANVGYLPEDRGLYERARVLETLVYLARLRGCTDRARLRREALQWLERLDLGEYAEKRIETLSKGMQQKVQFIAAVLHRPQLAVLDEPFSGLDPVNQELFVRLIRELREEGMTVLLSSHQMNLVEALCDRVLVLHRGRAVLRGTVEEIQKAHGERVVGLRLINPPDDLAPLLEDSRVRQARTDGRSIELHLQREARLSEFVKEALERYEVEELSVHRSSLHEIFVRAVGGDAA